MVSKFVETCRVAFAVLIVALSALTSSGTPIDIYETFKDRRFAGEAVILNENAEYVLSQDYRFQKEDGSPVTLRLERGNSFDFSDGNHTLSAAGTRVAGNGASSSISVKGGVWDMCMAGSFCFGGWDVYDYTGWTWSVEDAVITNNQGNFTMMSGHGTNRTVQFKRSTLHCGTNYSDLTPIAADKDYDYGALIEFADGSRMLSDGLVYDNRNTVSSIPMNLVLRFTGAGSGYAPIHAGKQNNFVLGHKSPKARVEIVDGATFVANALTVGNHQNGDSNDVCIVDGVATIAQDVTIGAVAGSDDNSVIVSGADAGLTCSSSMFVGKAGSRNRFTVSASAVAATTRLYIGKEVGAGGNAITVEDGATLSVTTGDVSIGNETNCVGNGLYVLGGHLVLSDLSSVFVGDSKASESVMVVSNGSINAKSIVVGRNGGVGNFLRVQGEDASLSFTGTGEVWTVSGAGVGNRVELCDGVQISLRRLQFGDFATNGVLRITRNAQIDVAEYCWLSADGNSPSAKDCTIEVSKGAVLATGDIRVNGVGNTLLIDDGTVRCRSDFATFFNNNEKIRLRGVAPLLTTYGNDNGHLEFRNNSEVIFELPPDGTVYAQAPLQAANYVNFAATATLRFENLDAFRKSLNNHAHVPLVVQGTGNGIAKGVIDDANANLAAQGMDYARVVSSADGKSLTLRVRAELGMVVTIR